MYRITSSCSNLADVHLNQYIQAEVGWSKTAYLLSQLTNGITSIPLASSLLKALQNEISAVDPSGTAYTAFITSEPVARRAMFLVNLTSSVAVSSRLAVEMSSIGGSGQVQFVAATATLSTQSHDAPTFTAAPASTGNRANDAASSPTGLPSVPTALASSGGPARKSNDALRVQCSRELMTTLYVPSLELAVRDRYGFANAKRFSNQS